MYTQKKKNNKKIIDYNNKCIFIRSFITHTDIGTSDNPTLIQCD